MTPTELWLPIGAAGFYLYDSIHLLWQNELLFARTASGWRVSGGSGLRWFGRRVYLPNPLQPQHLIFPVRWSSADTRGLKTEAAAIDALRTALAPVGWIMQILAALLLIALPAISWTLGAGLFLLIVFAKFYLLILLALVIVYSRREALQMTRRNFWSLAFDCLACAPFAVNMVRKIALRHGIAGDPVQFGTREFDTATAQQMRSIIEARTNEEHPT